MALSSKCPCCPSTSFEVSIETPKNSNFKLQFIRCSACGVVVGTTEYYNIGAMIEALAIKLGIKLS